MSGVGQNQPICFLQMPSVGQQSVQRQRFPLLFAQSELIEQLALRSVGHVPTSFRGGHMLISGIVTCQWLALHVAI